MNNTETNTAPVRTTSIIKISELLDSRMSELTEQDGCHRRIVQITARQSKGDIEVIFWNTTKEINQMVLLRADGTWSGLSYCHNEQI